MPFTPDAPFPKSRGQILRSKDWNDLVAEVQRLDVAKLSKIGDAGPLSINVPGSNTPLQVVGLDVQSFGIPANARASYFLRMRDVGAANPNLFLLRGDGWLGLGTDTPQDQLHVTTSATVGSFGVGSSIGRFTVTGSNAEIGFVRRNLTAWPASPQTGDRYLWYNQTGTAALWTDVVGDLLRVNSSGELTLRNSAGGIIPTFTGRGYDNESSFKANNLKLSLGSVSTTQFTPSPPPDFEFTVGHVSTVRRFVNIGGGGGGIGGGIGGGGGVNLTATDFVKAFSVDQAGNGFFRGAISAGGGKGGYVTDNFINKVGDTLEQGDVVVIGSQGEMRYYGMDNSIPIPEVDLTNQAYDHRVCGIVDRVMTEDLLPYAEVKFPSQADIDSGKITEFSPENPLRPLAAKSDVSNPLQVEDQQLGKMVTLGAYAFCKVDADIAAIEPGDLLTSSPTKGHAQKVLEPEKAMGAILGKALAGLASGRGKIPVIVLLQ